MLIAAAISTGGGVWGAQTPGKERPKLLAELESETPAVRAKASAEALARRDPSLIPAVIAIVEKYLPDDTRRGTVKDNMLLLGKLRAVEAIPLLARNLTYEVFYKETKRLQTTEDFYPAVRSLIDIGQPSLRPVLAAISSEDGETLEKNGAAVLKGILGRSGAHELLANEAAAARDEKARARLRRAMAALEGAP